MASHATAPVGEAVSIGRIIQRGVAVVVANPVVVLGIAFVFGALPTVVFSAVVGVGRPAGLASGMSGLAWGSFLLGLVCMTLVHSALVRAALAHDEGRKATFGECLTSALPVLLPLILLSIAIGVCVVLGLMLLIVPGIMLYVVWSVASPALVAERDGVGAALGRSRHLTSGARWTVFGLQLIILASYWLVAGGLGYAAIVAAGGAQDAARYAVTGLPIAWLIVNTLVSTLTNSFWSTTQTALYIELRDWKDGPSADRLSDVFA